MRRHRLGGVGDHLLDEVLELLELGRRRLELLAGEGGLELDHVGEGLGAEQVLGEGEGSVAIRLDRVDRLDAEGEGAVTPPDPRSSGSAC